MLVQAYDTRTGQEYLVRKEAVGHPIVGPHLSLTPPSPLPASEPEQPPASSEAPAPTNAPDAGDQAVQPPAAPTTRPGRRGEKE
ncbi:hypothetical protein [Oerskovia paurometabola]|uniref:Uncharacterized protein n=1 Tax=Oerskovia paurometabola TaxID=162170 RepID=A0ABW1X7Q0_9CELL|nr:hypothetical protein [Oerskovia paurometabola]MBM7497807.1 hypothetical protein [Oerskovia paurometabola]